MAALRGMKLRSRGTDPGRLETGLTIRICKEKGRCVYTTQKITKGELFLKYHGKLLTDEPETEDDRYIVEFTFKEKTCWMDVTEEDGSFGRLINDSVDAPNCKVKVKEENQKPSLYFFFVLCDIDEGEEILYNYGPGVYPWRSEKRKKVTRPYPSKHSISKAKYDFRISSQSAKENPKVDRAATSSAGELSFQQQEDVTGQSLSQQEPRSKHPRFSTPSEKIGGDAGSHLTQTREKHGLTTTMLLTSRPMAHKQQLNTGEQSQCPSKPLQHTKEQSKEKTND